MVMVCAAACAKTAHSPSGKSVKGSGCIENAVENSCHVVIDSKTGELYSLLFSAKAPKSGTAITFKGTAHKGATACTPGKPVTVSKWKKEEGIKCPPPVIAQAAPKH
jgi:hypothetical protein